MIQNRYQLTKEQQNILVDSGKGIKLETKDPHYEPKRLALHHPDWILRHREIAKNPGREDPYKEYEIWEYIPETESAKKAHDYCNYVEKMTGIYPQDIARKSYLPHEVLKLKKEIKQEKVSLWKKVKNFFSIGKKHPQQTKPAKA